MTGRVVGQPPGAGIVIDDTPSVYPAPCELESLVNHPVSTPTRRSARADARRPRPDAGGLSWAGRLGWAMFLLTLAICTLVMVIRDSFLQLTVHQIGDQIGRSVYVSIWMGFGFYAVLRER